ncbi:MAG: hypothetical protein PF904_14595 [Kiritimatiellae bacterium]|jgi:hypothetical protein|nr:hypothetical protein [Kiritimatiellia bacterium]
MKHSSILLLLMGFIACAPCFGETAAETTPSTDEGHSAIHKIAMYIPNVVLDLFDVVRLRARVGPGIAADVRATKLASVFVGSYDSVYAGLPGPRNRPKPKLPIGLESRNGVQVSVIDATEEGNTGPDYGPAEIGLGVHVLIIGVDVGVEPLELLDFVTGIFFIDLRDDDL